MRILGLDYGSRRIGVAICDELGMTAQGAATIDRKNREADLDAIADLVRRYDIERIVIGYPLRLDGSEGVQCEKINRFCRRLETRFTFPSSVGTKPSPQKRRKRSFAGPACTRRKEKEFVDRVAASIILQGYLDALARGEKGREYD